MFPRFLLPVPLISDASAIDARSDCNSSSATWSTLSRRALTSWRTTPTIMNGGGSPSEILRIHSTAEDQRKDEDSRQMQMTKQRTAGAAGIEVRWRSVILASTLNIASWLSRHSTFCRSKAGCERK